MNIIVTNVNEDVTIYQGDADDFLFSQLNDEELECQLNELEGMDVCDTVDYETLEGEVFTIEKDEDSEL